MLHVLSSSKAKPLNMNPLHKQKKSSFTSTLMTAIGKISDITRAALLLGRLDSLLPQATCIDLRSTYGVSVCVRVYIRVYKCARWKKKRDGRQVSEEKKGEGRASKSISLGSESTICTDSGVFSL